MKVLFVSSGNSEKFEIAPFIKVQGESIKQFGVDIEYFKVTGKGITGYIKSGFRLRKFLQKNNFDIIHAHYTLSGWTAVIGAYNKTKIVLSLMGSDSYGDYIAPNKVRITSKYITILTYLIQPFVKTIISKSKNIEKFVWLKKKSIILPNGIDLSIFHQTKETFKKELALNDNCKHVLFLGNKNNVRKNYKLVEKAINILNVPDLLLINPFPVSHNLVFKYLNEADVLVLASLAEGSPNIIKEAMACNCPIVATDVGDIRWLFGDEPGHFITTFDPEDVAEKIKSALEFAAINGRTHGRDRIIELGLDADTVSKELIMVYKDVLKNAKQ
jgi:glycosyltransferase involved in cell wall biosynthesis